MRKLIDADKLSDQIRIMRTPFRDTMLAIVESMPDVGCARGQAHSGTQWCAEVVEMGREIERLKGERGNAYMVYSQTCPSDLDVLGIYWSLEDAQAEANGYGADTYIEEWCKGESLREWKKAHGEWVVYYTQSNK